MASRLNTRLGLQVPSFTYPDGDGAQIFDQVIAQARAAENAGYDSFWVMDHFYQLPMLGSPDEPMLEAYTLLAGVAAQTSTIQLGAMVGGVTYRNPAFLAKTVTTLDVISKGRAIWGIGAGWYEAEHDGYGYEFGTFTDRFEKLEEALQIVKGMFTESTVTFDGKWYQVKDALNSPPPVREGGPPIMIGGSGEKKTLRMVAQYGDACNVFGGPDQIRHLMGVLDQHCERLGRDPADIWRTRLGTVVVAPTMEVAKAGIGRRFGVGSFDDLPEDLQLQISAAMTFGDPDTVGEELQAFRDAGLDGIVLNMPGTPVEHIDAVAAVAKPIFS
ncbi:MAG: LLM class F420-dependent oxidoreductase [Acidimicrobiia bacterium]|nr:LLM class F420-dependent oxidoreductase [Acidimicrobiia bacterium]